jgi:hypothetical protein
VTSENARTGRVLGECSAHVAGASAKLRSVLSYKWASTLTRVTASKQRLARSNIGGGSVVAGPRAVSPPSDTEAARRSLDDTEAELLEIANALDEPVEQYEFKLAVLVLSQRTRTYFRGFLALQQSSVPAAARLLLRPMLEINTLIRFLRKDPELHVELWEAEGERNAVAMVEEHNAEHTDRWGPMTLRPGVMDEKRARVDEARRKALAAGVPGVRKSGPVLPSTAHQLKAIDEPAASEAYTYGYRPTGWDTHAGARSFVHGDFVERNDGTVSYEDISHPGDQLGIRALAVTAFASTMELASIVLDLSVEADARAILLAYVPQEKGDPPSGNASPSVFQARFPPR